MKVRIFKKEAKKLNNVEKLNKILTNSLYDVCLLHSKVNNVITDKMPNPTIGSKEVFSEKSCFKNFAHPLSEENILKNKI